MFTARGDFQIVILNVSKENGDSFFTESDQASEHSYCTRHYPNSC